MSSQGCFQIEVDSWLRWAGEGSRSWAKKDANYAVKPALVSIWELIVYGLVVRST